MVIIDMNDSGKNFVKSQVTDYQLRGDELEDYNLLDFFVDTYETDIPQRDRDDILFEEETSRGPGRPRHERIWYQENHPKYTQKYRVMRTQNHRNLPNFIGRKFPRRDDSEIHEFYCACMLMLLKPWRNMNKSLKGENESWTEAFKNYLSNASGRIHALLSGIQYYHECSTSAAQEKKDEQTKNENEERGEYTEYDEQEEDDMGIEETDLFRGCPLTEEVVQDIVNSQTSEREKNHTKFALEVAKQSRIFPSDNTHWVTSPNRTVSNATGGDVQLLFKWVSQLKQDVIDQNNPDIISGTSLPADTPTVDCLDLSSGGINANQQSEPTISVFAAEASLPSLDPSMLKTDQRRAYETITWHLNERLIGNNLLPLRMIMYGEGGTGKSKVIQCITDAFTKAGTFHSVKRCTTFRFIQHDRCSKYACQSSVHGRRSVTH
jgi:hypothetical protein